MSLLNVHGGPDKCQVASWKQVFVLEAIKNIATISNRVNGDNMCSLQSLLWKQAMVLKLFEIENVCSKKCTVRLLAFHLPRAFLRHEECLPLMLYVRGFVS